MDDFERGLISGLEQAAMLVDGLWSDYSDHAAKAALGLAADKIREQAATLRSELPADNQHGQ